MSEGEGEKVAEAPPAAPPPEEKPIIDLTEIIKSRRAKGEGLGFTEALMYMQYMDSREERMYRRQQMERGSNPELEARLKALEKKYELEAALGPIREQMKTLTGKIEKLGERPATPPESEGMRDIRTSLTALDKRLDALDQRYQFSNEIQGLRGELTSLKEAVNQGGGAAPSSAADMIDQATGLIDKILELTKKPWAGGAGEEGFDWRVAAINTSGEIATEAIKTAKAIYAGKEETLEEAPEERKREKVSEHIIDRKVLGYLGSKLSTGAKEFNTKEAAKALGLTPDQVFDSYKRLRDRGLLKEMTRRRKGGQEKREATTEAVTEAEAEGLVEG